MAEMALTISFTSWAGPMGLAAMSAPESRLQGKMSCGGGRYNRPLGSRPVRPARRRTRQAAIHYNISLDGASAVRPCALFPFWRRGAFLRRFGLCRVPRQRWRNTSDAISSQEGPRNGARRIDPPYSACIVSRLFWGGNRGTRFRCGVGALLRKRGQE